MYVLQQSPVTFVVFLFKTDLRDETAGKLGNIIDGAQTGYQLGSCGGREDGVVGCCDQDQKLRTVRFE